MAFFVGDRFVCGDPDPWVNGKRPKPGEFCLADCDHRGLHQPGTPPPTRWPNPGWSASSTIAPRYPSNVNGIIARWRFRRAQKPQGEP